MALLKLGSLAVDIRGSVGGVTFARNRGGAYARARVAPLNPASPQQGFVRSTLADLVQRWSSALTASQRAAWNLYADNVLLNNSLGEPRKVSGINMYVRSNQLIIQTGGSVLDTAPTTFTVGPTFSPVFDFNAANDTFDVDGLGGYTPPTGGVRLFISQSTPQNPGVNFHKSPFRQVFGDLIPAGAFTPINAQPLAFPIASGQAVFMRSIAVLPDGRVGGSVIQRFLVA